MKRSFLILFVAAGVAFPQAAAHANSRYRTKDGRAGIAKNLAAGDRDARQRPKELVAALRLQPGMTVADLGTGVGYMLPHLAAAVGPAGKVIAEDIFPDFLDQARQTAERHSLANVTFVLGTEKDPKLPENAVDLALALDAYHHFDYPESMLAAIARGLRPGGRLVVVDFYKAAFDDPNHIRLDEAAVIQEIEANGFRLLSRREFIPKRQYLAEFEKK